MKKNHLLLTILFLSAVVTHSQNYKEDWVTYVVEKEKGPMTVSSNLWYSYNGKPNYKNLLVVGTSTKNCFKNGYPNYLGLAKFYSFSDSIATKIDKVTKSRLLGVLTYQCSGFDVYYVKDTVGLRKEIQHFLDYNDALSKNYITIKRDKKWTYYKSLVPKDLSDSFFTNHEFLNKLVTEGDDLKTPRKISHWINFKTEKRRQQFINKIQPLDFKVDTLSLEKNTTHKYQVKISRKDVATPEAIRQLTQNLIKFSIIYYGVYDGWGTEPLKEEE